MRAHTLVIGVSGVLIACGNQPAPARAPTTQRPSPIVAIPNDSPPVATSNVPTPNAPSVPTASIEPSPEKGWVTTIPADLPLGYGLPKPGGDVPKWDLSDKKDRPWDWLRCSGNSKGKTPQTQDDKQKAARFVSVSPPEENLSRQLLVYADHATARAAYESIVASVESCAPRQTENGEWRWTAKQATFGNHSGVVIGASVPASRSLIAVVREGNALLVAQLSDEATVVDPTDLSDGDAKELADHVSAIADAMCIYKVEPCDEMLLPLSDRPIPLAKKLCADQHGGARPCTGRYFCQIVDDGTVYAPQRCIIERTPEGEYHFEKVGGSQRLSGTVLPTPNGDLRFSGRFFCPWGDCEEPAKFTLVANEDGWVGAMRKDYIVTISRHRPTRPPTR